jgi:hypothetical protein
MTMHTNFNNFMPPPVRAHGEGILGGMGEYFSGAYELQGMGIPPRVHAYRDGSLGEQVSTMPRYAPISGIGEYFEGLGFTAGPATYVAFGSIGLALGAYMGYRTTKRTGMAAIGAVVGLALGATIPYALKEQTG